MFHTLTIQETIKKLKTDLDNGLSERDVQARQKLYGKNELVKNKKTSIIVKFFNQFKDFMILILIFAAVVSAIISYIEGREWPGNGVRRTGCAAWTACGVFPRCHW